MPLSESSAYDPRSPNASPPSLGPGARPMSSQNPKPGPPPDPTATLKEIAEVRSHYSVAVDRDSTPSTLNVGYDIRNLSRKYTIPFQNMPLNSATTWLLYGGRGRAAVTGVFVIDTIRGAENMAGRPLTQSEAEGFAVHASRRTLYSFAANLSALAIGCGMALIGRKSMKFPFRKPQPLDKYDNFPNRWVPLLKGQYARAMWHITRANIYVFVGILLLNPLYKSMGNSALMVGLYRDSRTHEVMKTMKERGQQLTRLGSNREMQEQFWGQTPQQQPQGKYEDPDPEGYYNDTETGVLNDYNGGRDYNGDPAGNEADANGTTDTGMLDDSTMKQRENSQSSPSTATRSRSSWGRPSRSPPWGPSATQNEDADASSSGNSGDFFFDDASPTAGSGLLPPIAADSNSTGSAWDRVRRSQPSAESNPRGITPPGTRPKPGLIARGLQQREGEHQGQTQGERYSYDSAEEEKQLAKEIAQREFEEMLERERYGSRDREVSSIGSGFGQQGEGNREGESAWERRRRRG